MTRLLVLLVAMSACGGSGGSTDAAGALDLSAVADGAMTDLSQRDLAREDLDKPVDLARTCENRVDLAGLDLTWNGCAGTALANTCVAAYFSSFASCFVPAGHCQLEPHNFGSDGAWTNGAFFYSGLGPAYYFEAGYQMSGNTCLDSFVANDTDVVHFCEPGENCVNDYDLDAGVAHPSGGAFYDRDSGVFTCPDGTQVDVGANLGSCPVLNALLSPTTMCDFCGSP